MSRFLMPTDVPLTSVYRRNIRFFEDYEQTCSSLLGSHSPLHPHNSTSLLPAPLTSRPQPFRFTLGSPGMTNTAQAPHRRIQRNMSVPPINSMPLPGQREPHKRPRRLLTRYRHRTGAPKLVLIRMGGTQNRGEHRQGSGLYWSRCLPVRLSRSGWGGRETEPARHLPRPK